MTALICHGQGPYTALLSNGDTLTGKTYYTRGDTFGLPGTAKVLAKDVVLFWTPKERWTFTYPGGRMRKIKQEADDPCSRGSITAIRCEEHPTTFDSLPVPAAWKQEQGMLDCYRTKLQELNVRVDENGDRRRKAAPVPIILADHLVHLRNGDSLTVGSAFYTKADSLCWMGGGRMHKDRVLWMRSKDRRMLMVDRNNTLITMPADIAVDSACGKGRILTLIYERSTRSEEAINAASADLLHSIGIAACFSRPVKEGKRTVTDPLKRRSFASLSIGYGGLHGLFGLNGVIGPNGSGLSIGLGGANGGLGYSIGVQFAVKKIFFVNASYGILERGAIGNYVSMREYTTEGYILGTGLMIHFDKAERTFLQLGFTYAGGGTRPLPFGGREKVGGPGFDGGIGFRF
ncbi:MAG TPA: hypothetical protein VGE21_15770 [Flavobacteriales bacterium]